MKLFILPAALFACAVTALAQERVVSIGGGLTELLHALELDSRLVGVDSSSVYPESLSSLPVVGYARALSAEGVLSLNPTLVICTEDAGPPAALEQIRKAGVEILQLPSDPTVETLEFQIDSIAAKLGQKGKATALKEKIRDDLRTASLRIPEDRPRVLFIYARSGGVLNASGRGTHADAMIQFAGGMNAIHEYEGFKPLTAEAALLAAPDVILLTSRGIQDVGGPEAILNHPGISGTPAAKNHRIVAMEDLLLLGFSSRLGKAVGELSELIHRTPGPTVATKR